MANKLELLLNKLYNDPVDKFYAYLYYQVDRVEDKKCPTMGVGLSRGRLKLWYNKNFMEKLSDKANVEVLKHEALHLINQHVTRGKGAKEKNSMKHKMENLAMDCAINQYLNLDIIEEIGGVTLKSFRKMLTYKPESFQLEEKRNYEYYYDLLEQEKNERDKNGEGQEMEQQLDDLQMDDHGSFGDLDPLDQAMLEDKIRKAAEQAKANGAGNLPGEVEELLKMMRKPTQNWKRLINQFQGAQTKANTRATRSRRNRRYGIKVAGKKQDHVARILCVLDTSGSMSGSRTEKVLNELYGAWKNSPGNRLDIIQCDTEIKDVFTYDGKEEFKITGRGGTNVQPSLTYAEENGYDGCIICTDGEFYGEELKCKVPSLWIVAENSSYKSPIGQTVNLD